MQPAQPGFNTVANAPSRGALTADFLTGTQAPLAYLQGLPTEVRTRLSACVTNRWHGTACMDAPHSRALA